jgi:hypothetical protein
LLVVENDAPLSFEKKAAERKLFEIVTPRDKPSSAQSIISPPSRKEAPPEYAARGGEMKRTGGCRPTLLRDDFDLQRNNTPCPEIVASGEVFDPWVHISARIHSPLQMELT